MNQEEQKEKYSAFISNISEILGLGKPVDILKLCMVTDRFFKPLQNQIKELEEQNVELIGKVAFLENDLNNAKAQIEKMKCCANCALEYPKTDGNSEICRRCRRYPKPFTEWKLDNGRICDVF